MECPSLEQIRVHTDITSTAGTGLHTLQEFNVCLFGFFNAHTLILLLTAMLGYILISLLLFISKYLPERIKMSQNIHELFRIPND